MAIKVTTQVRGSQAQLKALQSIRPKSVLVGIPENNDGRAATYPGGLTSNATIGYLQETGNPSTNLPARPHLEPGVRAILPRADLLIRAALRKQLAGDSKALDAGLNMIGLLAVASVRRRIQSNIPPPLSPRTIANRLYRLASYQNATPRRRRAMAARWAARRFTALIDTGAYAGAITYVIRNRP